jgi:hypothetical protein
LDNSWATSLWRYLSGYARSPSRSLTKDSSLDTGGEHGITEGETNLVGKNYERALLAVHGQPNSRPIRVGFDPHRVDDDFKSINFYGDIGKGEQPTTATHGSDGATFASDGDGITVWFAHAVTARP